MSRVQSWAWRLGAALVSTGMYWALAFGGAWGDGLPEWVLHLSSILQTSLAAGALTWLFITLGAPRFVWKWVAVGGLTPFAWVLPVGIPVEQRTFWVSIGWILLLAADLVVGPVLGAYAAQRLGGGEPLPRSRAALAVACAIAMLAGIGLWTFGGYSGGELGVVRAVDGYTASIQLESPNEVVKVHHPYSDLRVGEEVAVRTGPLVIPDLEYRTQDNR